jgi:hypothetical protein
VTCTGMAAVSVALAGIINVVPATMRPAASVVDMAMAVTRIDLIGLSYRCASIVDRSLIG